jgi:DNA integrity scanning protein DisA with diadenylate cyclase activity
MAGPDRLVFSLAASFTIGVMKFRSAVRLIRARVPGCDRSALESTLTLALEIAREGREGRHVGTIFTFGRAESVLRSSRALILDPLAGQETAARRVSDPDLRGTVKELAQLDGAFVVTDDGVVAGACRYLDVSADDVSIPLGLGSRHLAGAAVSMRLGVIAIVVSESGVVRVFHDGQCIVQLPDGADDSIAPQTSHVK